MSVQDPTSRKSPRQPRRGAWGRRFSGAAAVLGGAALLLILLIVWEGGRRPGLWAALAVLLLLCPLLHQLARRQAATPKDSEVRQPADDEEG